MAWYIHKAMNQKYIVILVVFIIVIGSGALGIKSFQETIACMPIYRSKTPTIFHVFKGIYRNNRLFSRYRNRLY